MQGIGRRNPEHNLSAVVIDLHAPHDGPDDVPLAKPIKMVEPFLDFGREVLQATDQKGQVVLGLGGLKHDLALLLEASRTGFETTDPRFEFAAADHAIGIAVNQAADAALQAGNLMLKPSHLVGRGAVMGLCQTPPILRRHTVRVAEHVADLLPYQRLEPISTHRMVLTDRRAAKAIAIRSHAAIIPQLPLRAITATAPQGLAVIGVPAAPADGQPLQQPALTTAALALVLSILGQLRLSGCEELVVHKSRHRHLDPVLTIHRFATTTKPLAASDRLTISRTTLPVRFAAAAVAVPL